MEGTISKRRYTIEEYLRLELDALDKHEYYNGDIISMAGGSSNHSLIIANTIGALWSGLRGKPCRVYDSNLRVSVPRSAIYVYPDATVICGPLQYDPSDSLQRTVTNPKLIVEVLSPSSENRDYGVKRQWYIQCDSLEEYVIVAQDTAHVETLFRQGDGTWLLTPVMNIAQSARLRSLGIDLPLTEVYAGVEFPTEPVMPVTSQDKL